MTTYKKLNAIKMWARSLEVGNEMSCYRGITTLTHGKTQEPTKKLLLTFTTFIMKTEQLGRRHRAVLVTRYIRANFPWPVMDQVVTQ